MKNSLNALLLSAALTGLVGGTMAAAQPTQPGQNGSTKTSASKAAVAGVRLTGMDQDKGKHACKGKNDCKGQGGCKAGDNGCKGKNSCKARADALPMAPSPRRTSNSTPCISPLGQDAAMTGTGFLSVSVFSIP